MFSGRWEEIAAIEQCLKQSAKGNPAHFLVEGERGIGKSSLLWVESLVARGRLHLMGGTEKLSYIVVGIKLRDTDDMYAIIRRLSQALKKEMAEHDKLKDYVLKAWDLISRLEVKGVGLKSANHVDEEELLQLFEDDLVHVLRQYQGEIDGILLLIDEADKAAPEANLGLICKLLTEALAEREASLVCIGLAGLPTTTEILRASHESSTRLFSIMNLKPLEVKECIEVIEKGLKEAADKNGFATAMTDSAKTLVAELSEGYPHFLQEFLFFAFEADTDNEIDNQDVQKSLFDENGVFDQLGKKYFSDFYISQIGSDAYRHVLQTMAEHMDAWVDRATLIKESGLKDDIVDNAVRALKARKIIAHNPAKKGEYRLPTKSFAVWIKVQQAVGPDPRAKHGATSGHDEPETLGEG